MDEVCEERIVGPFFSVLIPCYNVEKYINECIQSVLSQTFSDWEIIAIDDGSTDATGVLLDKLAVEIGPRVRVYHTINRGLLSARAEAVRQARGRIAVFLDSDDMLHNQTLSILHDYIENDPDCLIQFRLTRDKSYQNPLVMPYPVGNSPIKVKVSWFRRAVCASDAFNNLCGKAFPLKDYPKSVECFRNVEMAEDLVQLVFVLDKVKDIILLDDCLYYYRLNENSITQNYSPKHYLSARAAHEELERHAKEWNDEECISLLEQRWLQNIARIVVGLSLSDYPTASIIKELSVLGMDERFRSSYHDSDKRRLSAKRRVILYLLHEKHYGLLAHLLCFNRMVNMYSNTH